MITSKGTDSRSCYVESGHLLQQPSDKLLELIGPVLVSAELLSGFKWLPFYAWEMCRSKAFVFDDDCDDLMKMRFSSWTSKLTRKNAKGNGSKTKRASESHGSRTFRQFQKCFNLIAKLFSRNNDSRYVQYSKYKRRCSCWCMFFSHYSSCLRCGMLY